MCFSLKEFDLNVSITTIVPERIKTMGKKVSHEQGFMLTFNVGKGCGNTISQEV
jgi:hypothetical protein